MFILDSSAIIAILNGTTNGREISKILVSEVFFASVFSVYEIMLGVKANEIRLVNEFFSNIKVLEFDRKAAIQSALIERNLIKEGKMIQKVDIFIAALCISRDMTLITTDKGFQRVSGLKLRIVG